MKSFPLVFSNSNTKINHKILTITMNKMIFNNSLIAMIMTLYLLFVLKMNDAVVSSIKDKDNIMLRREEMNVKSSCEYEGDYCKSCFDCYTVKEVILRCFCFGGTDTSHPVYINVTSCDFGITNDHGKLVCSLNPPE